MALLQTHRVCFAIVRGSTVVLPSYDRGFDSPGASGSWYLDPSQATWTDGTTTLDASTWVAVSGSDDAGTITITSAMPANRWRNDATITVALIDDFSTPLGSVTLHLRTLPDYFLAHGTEADEVTLEPPSVGAFSLAMSVAAAPAALAGLRFAPGTRRLELPVAYGAWPAASDAYSFDLSVEVSDAANPSNGWTASFTGAGGPSLALRKLGVGSGQLAGFSWLAGRVAVDAERAIDLDLPATASASATLIGLPGSITFDAGMRIQEEAPTGTTDSATADLEIDYDGARPRVRGTFAIESRSLAAGIPWDFAAGTLPLQPDPGGGRFTYDAASAPGFVLGGIGTQALSVSWGAGLVAGSAATLDLHVTRAIAGYPQEHVQTTLSVGALPQTIDVVPQLGATPTGRALRSYTLPLRTTVAQGAGEVLDFGADLATVAPLELVDDSPAAPDTKVLRTIAGGGIPAAWGSAHDVSFRPALRDATTNALLRGGNVVTLTIPISALKPITDVALVIDRSGSMISFSRWEGAMNGAKQFAELVQTANSTLSKDHRVGVYWFSGWEPGVDNYPQPAPPRPPEGNYGVLSKSGGAPLDLRKPDAAFIADLDQARVDRGPLHMTSIGAGLLFARERLLSAANERVLLCFTDGMQNRPPTVADAVSPARWHDGGPDPEIRVYSAALGTTAAYADQLRIASSATGGDGTYDVKHIPSASNAAMEIVAWFNARFAQLFGYSTAIAPHDPELSGGQSAAHPIEATMGHRQLVISLITGRPHGPAPAGARPAWEVQLQPPGTSDVLTEDDLRATGGVRFLEGTMYKTLVVDLPLAVGGHGHRWAGTWTLHVVRNEAGSEPYLVTAMARQDLALRVFVAAPPRPRAPARATIVAYLELAKGVKVDGVKMEATVTGPGAWLDDVVAREAARRWSAKPLAKGEDALDVAEQIAAELVREGVARPTRKVVLHHRGGGRFEGDFVADAPGPYDVHVRAEGVRVAPPDDRLLAKAAAEIKALYPAERAAEEMARLKKESGSKQGFALEQAASLGVDLLVDAPASSPLAAFLDAKTLRLAVRPADARGRLLGVGRASSIVFTGPCGLRIPASDARNGTYYADLRFAGRGVRYDPFTRTVRGAPLVIETPGAKHELCTNAFSLAELGVELAGERMPLAVRGRLVPIAKGDAKRHDALTKEALAAAASAVSKTKRLGASPPLARALDAALIPTAKTQLAAKVRAHALRAVHEALCRECHRELDPATRRALSSVLVALDAVLERVPDPRRAEWKRATFEQTAPLIDVLRSVRERVEGPKPDELTTKATKPPRRGPSGR